MSELSQGKLRDTSNQPGRSLSLSFSVLTMASNPMESIRGRQVALSVVDAYNFWSSDSVISFRAPNCIHQIFPSSLSRAPMNNAAYREHFLTTLLPHFRRFHVTVRDIIEDAAANKVVLWASSTADSSLGPYANEYVLVLYFNPEGKVERCVEFVDSAYTVPFFRRLRELTKKLKDENAGKSGLRRPRL